MPPNQSEHNQTVEEVSRFWRHIFAGERGQLQIWTGVRDEQGEIPKDTINLYNYDYPGAAYEAAQTAIEKSAEEGREVYFCAHLLNGPERKKENAAYIHSLWAE